MAEKKIYQKTSVVVGEQHYNPETQLYSGEVETHFYKKQPFTLKVFDTPEKKEGDRGTGVIVGEINIAGKKISFRERENEYGKQYAGSIIKGEFFVNLERVLGRGDVDSYEIKFIERDLKAEAATDVENTDVPF